MAKTKQGFTLVEAMVLMLLGSIALAASMPLISRRYTELKKINHGMYVCSYDGSDVSKPFNEQLFKNGALVAKKPVAECIFHPPAKAEYFMVHIMGAGGGGGHPGAVGSMSSSSRQGGPIPVASPVGSLPSDDWLSPGDYEAYGSVSVYVPSATGGTGGGQTANGGTTVCSGGPGKTIASVNTSIRPKYINTSVNITTGCNGRNGTSRTEESGGTVSDGSAGKSGILSFASWGLSFGTGAIANGGKGNPVNGVTCTYVPTPTSSAASNTTIDCSGTTTPTYTTDLYWDDYFRTTQWKYAEGGQGGEFDSMFIPSFKGSIKIVPGEGGAAGTTGTFDGFEQYQGGKGGTTCFGQNEDLTCLEEEGGGVGGKGNKLAGGGTYYEVGSSASPAGCGSYSSSGNPAVWTCYGAEGSQSLLNKVQIAFGFTSEHSLSMVGYAGKGGRGGGTKGTCQAGSSYTYHQFGDSGNYYYSKTCDTFVGDTTAVEAPQAGYGGAVFIYW